MRTIRFSRPMDIGEASEIVRRSNGMRAYSFQRTSAQPAKAPYMPVDYPEAAPAPTTLRHARKINFALGVILTIGLVLLVRQVVALGGWI